MSHAINSARALRIVSIMLLAFGSLVVVRIHLLAEDAGKAVQDQEKAGPANEAPGSLKRLDYSPEARGLAEPMRSDREGKSYATRRLMAEPDLRHELERLPKLRQLQQGLHKVEIDGETLYIAEGDILLDEDQLLFYADQRQAQEEVFRARQRSGRFARGLAEATTDVSGRLVGIQVDGRLVRWGPDAVLRYCVLKKTFSDNQQYQAVVQNMQEATAQWEAICGVRFRHRPELDDSPSVTIPTGVIFCVRSFDAGGAFIASAFFPTDPRARRKLLVDPSYFGTTFDRVGVFRHELGHVLGFRHEHIRSEAPAVCPHEDTGFTFNLTNYDPRSVMHYFCGGAGTRSLGFSVTDRQGAQSLYGPPLGSLRIVEVDEQD